MLPTQQFQGESLLKGTHFGGGREGGGFNSQSAVVSFPGNTLVSPATEKSSL